MQRRFRSLISALAVFVYAVVGVGAVHAESLCVGADGHVAFEGPAGDDTCHGQPLLSAPSNDPVLEITGRGAAGAECVDFALPGRTVLKAQGQVIETAPAIFAWVLVRVAPPAATLPRRAPTFDIRASSARTLTSHRSTILLI